MRLEQQTTFARNSTNFGSSNSTEEQDNRLHQILTLNSTSKNSGPPMFKIGKIVEFMRPRLILI